MKVYSIRFDPPKSLAGLEDWRSRITHNYQSRIAVLQLDAVGAQVMGPRQLIDHLTNQTAQEKRHGMG